MCSHELPTRDRHEDQGPLSYLVGRALWPRGCQMRPCPDRPASARRPSQSSAYVDEARPALAGPERQEDSFMKTWRAPKIVEIPVGTEMLRRLRGALRLQPQHRRGGGGSVMVLRCACVPGFGNQGGVPLFLPEARIGGTGCYEKDACGGAEPGGHAFDLPAGRLRIAGSSSGCGRGQVPARPSERVHDRGSLPRRGRDGAPLSRADRQMRLRVSPAPLRGISLRARSPRQAADARGGRRERSHPDRPGQGRAVVLFRSRGAGHRLATGVAVRQPAMVLLPAGRHALAASNKPAVCAPEHDLGEARCRFALAPGAIIPDIGPEILRDVEDGGALLPEPHRRAGRRLVRRRAAGISRHWLCTGHSVSSGALLGLFQADRLRSVKP